MEDKNLALAILGIIVVLAIVGLVLMFSMERTGAGIYMNYDYYKGQVADPFPIARQTGEAKVMEMPATTVSGQEPGARKYGGGSQFFITGTEKGVKSNLGKAYTTYKRSAETDIPSVYTTGVGLSLPGGVLATQCFSEQVYNAKVSNPARECFTEDIYGRKINDLLPQHYGCCGPTNI